jgi:putative addiction module killer protein
MFDLIHYADADGKDHFGRWLESLSDVQAQARVSARLIRLHRGNFGDCRAVGEGVWEIRIDWGPGYRVYYAVAGKQAILHCEGGDKRTQATDIQRAIARWKDWQQRRPR